MIHHYDSNVELFVTVPQYFYDNHGERSSIDEITEGAGGFVDGSKVLLKKPVILHKNHDRLDDSRNNLQWVESDCQEYQDYLTDKMKSIRDNIVKQKISCFYTILNMKVCTTDFDIGSAYLFVGIDMGLLIIGQSPFDICS